MKGSRQTLKRLVALRRQKAEQAMARIRMEIRQEEAAMAALETELQQLDRSAEDYASFSMAMRQGRPGHLQKRIEAARKTLEARRAELESARLALKTALHSEDRLQDMSD